MICPPTCRIHKNEDTGKLVSTAINSEVLSEPAKMSCDSLLLCREVKNSTLTTVNI